MLGEQPVVLARCGLGETGVRRVLPLLDNRRLAALVSTGTCGALAAGLKRGDLVAAEAVVGEGGETYECEGALVEAALAAAGREGIALRRGRLLCAAQVASEPEMRRRLSATHRALAVDMESGAVAAYAKRRAVPFLALKVVSDEADSWMLPLDLRGWLAHPLHRLLRLPLYLGGLARTALGYKDINRGLEAAAAAVAALSASGSCLASGSGAGRS
jgi:nucleoside phosphorylase